MGAAGGCSGGMGGCATTAAPEARCCNRDMATCTPVDESGNSASQDFDICLRAFCVGSSSPQLPQYVLVILPGEMTVSAIPRKTLQNENTERVI